MSSIVRSVEVPLGYGEPLKIQYNAGIYTPKFLEEMRDKSTREMLSLLIHTWDLTDDEGKPYPYDAESLENLPHLILNEIVDAITNDLVLKSGTGTPLVNFDTGGFSYYKNNESYESS